MHIKIPQSFPHQAIIFYKLQYFHMLCANCLRQGLQQGAQ